MKTHTVQFIKAKLEGGQNVIMSMIKDSVNIIGEFTYAKGATLEMYRWNVIPSQVESPLNKAFYTSLHENSDEVQLITDTIEPLTKSEYAIFHTIKTLIEIEYASDNHKQLIIGSMPQTFQNIRPTLVIDLDYLLPLLNAVFTINDYTEFESLCSIKEELSC